MPDSSPEWDADRRQNPTPDRPSPAIDRAVSQPRPADATSPLLDPGWRHLDNKPLDALTADDWVLLNAQRAGYLPGEKPKQALEMLVAQKDAPSFGYPVNNYEHCLQAATLALRDGRDDETVVACLFHDLGFVACNETHGEFAAALLRPYVSDRIVWTLQRHMYVQAAFTPSAPGADPQASERWRGHPHFAFAWDWVRRYDLPTIDATLDTASLADFVPAVHRVFGRAPRPAPLPE